MTIDPAYASFTESTLGSLEIGKKADFVILNQDVVSRVLASNNERKTHSKILCGNKDDHRYRQGARHQSHCHGHRRLTRLWAVLGSSSHKQLEASTCLGSFRPYFCFPFAPPIDSGWRLWGASETVYTTSYQESRSAFI